MRASGHEPCHHRALALESSREELDRLDQVSAIELGFPHDFDPAGLVYGTTDGLIDDRRLTGDTAWT